jgi:hypothetical protein
MCLPFFAIGMYCLFINLQINLSCRLFQANEGLVSHPRRQQFLKFMTILNVRSKISVSLRKDKDQIFDLHFQCLENEYSHLSLTLHDLRSAVQVSFLA